MTASYSVRFKRSAEKGTPQRPKPDLRRFIAKLARLASDPRPAGSTKLAGSEHYRIRQGDWPAIYEVDDEKRTVIVVKIGHRREVYR